MLRIVIWGALVGVFFFALLLWIGPEYYPESLVAFSICLTALFYYLIGSVVSALTKKKRTFFSKIQNPPSQYLSRLIKGRPDRKIIRVEEIDKYLEKGFAPISQTIRGRVVVELKLETPSYLARTYVLMLSLLLNGSRDR